MGHSASLPELPQFHALLQEKHRPVGNLPEDRNIITRDPQDGPQQSSGIGHHLASQEETCGSGHKKPRVP